MHNNDSTCIYIQVCDHYANPGSMGVRRHGQGGSCPPGNWTGWFRKSFDLLLQYFSLFTTTVSVCKLFSIVCNISLKLIYKHAKAKKNFTPAGFLRLFFYLFPPAAARGEQTKFQIKII